MAIVSAMQHELRALLPLISDHASTRLAGRIFHHGTIHGQRVVLVVSGIGKVAAATTAVLLMHEFDARALVFTGVAGGLKCGVEVGDVVVAQQLLQHDLDASPLYPPFEVPMTGRSRFNADPTLADALAGAARRCLSRAEPLVGAGHTGSLGIDAPRVHEGLIVSGDRFIASAAQSGELRALLPDALAVDMESAAVAQVCADFERPFAVLRTISDRADDQAPTDFTRFIDEVASVYTHVIVDAWLQQADR